MSSTEQSQADRTPTLNIKDLNVKHLRDRAKNALSRINVKELQQTILSSGNISIIHIVIALLNVLCLLPCLFINTLPIVILTGIFLFHVDKLEGEFEQKIPKMKQKYQVFKQIAVALIALTLIIPGFNSPKFWRAILSMTGHSTMLYELIFRLYGKFKVQINEIFSTD
ncbi:hypothetical protein M0813_30177 [Anaeramoeba flamelloides]|uniref:PRA1 family protein n=1 Tax=Anaeramoeba flamelloides TaxID=1746091 RepID=A0AAV7YLM5_9EUKA|nr:hypothetical protein M0812_23400 [Anaeramoeba flamelloides]KAJ6233212.1 hypothetical protein M0813_30177 [Anaeramoeba flamelloides]